MSIVVRGGSLKGIRYLREYFATHFAAVFAFYISVAVFAIAFIFMTYLKMSISIICGRKAMRLRMR